MSGSWQLSKAAAKLRHFCCPFFFFFLSAYITIYFKGTPTLSSAGGQNCAVFRIVFRSLLLKKKKKGCLGVPWLLCRTFPMWECLICIEACGKDLDKRTEGYDNQREICGKSLLNVKRPHPAFTNLSKHNFQGRNECINYHEAKNGLWALQFLLRTKIHPRKNFLFCPMSNTAKNQWETEFWSMLKICMWFF